MRGVLQVLQASFDASDLAALPQPPLQPLSALSDGVALIKRSDFETRCETDHDQRVLM